MNDAQELRFGRPELRAALVERADRLCPPGSEDGGPDCSKATLLRSAAEHLDQPGEIFASRQWHAVYVACFCESEDLLSQWRGGGGSGGLFNVVSKVKSRGAGTCSEIVTRRTTRDSPGRVARGSRASVVARDAHRHSSRQGLLWR